MKKLSLLPVLMLLLSLSLMSCSKEKDTEPTQTDLLAAGTWTGYGIYYTGTDVTKEFRDDLGYDVTKYSIKFDKAKTFLETYDGSTRNGKWEFANGDKDIILDKGTSDEYTLTILKLDAKELFVEYTIEIDGDEFVLEERYKLN
jgi:hypothetical protein